MCCSWSEVSSDDGFESNSWGIFSSGTSTLLSPESGFVFSVNCNSGEGGDTALCGGVVWVEGRGRFRLAVATDSIGAVIVWQRPLIEPIAATNPFASISLRFELLFSLLAAVVTTIAVLFVELSSKRGLLLSAASLFSPTSCFETVRFAFFTSTTGLRLLHTWHRRFLAELRRVHVPQVQSGLPMFVFVCVLLNQHVVCR